MRARALLFVAAVAACTSVDDPPRSLAPSNTCPTNDCTPYKQDGVTCTTGNFCEAGGTNDSLLLVVSVPESSVVAPGKTFANTYQDLLQIKKQSKGRCSATVCLPPLGDSAGTYQVEPAAAEQVKFYVGPPGFNYSIPTHVTLRPLWSFTSLDAGSFIDAPLAGIPLFPTFARFTFGDQLARPGPGDPMAPNVGYDAALANGQYERSMLPDPPFDQAYPPVIDVVQPNPFNPEQGGIFNNVLLGDSVSPVRSHELTVTRDGGTLDGWSVYLRDIVTERRISSRPILQEIGGKTVLFTVNQFGRKNEEIRDGVELVVAPPVALSIVPDLRISLVSNKVLDASYPALPTPVTIRGSVVSNRIGAASRIVFESTEVSPLRDASNRDLHFTTQTVTNAAGEYVVVIPPGKYKAIITPSDASGFAKTILDAVIGDTPQNQEGRNFEVLPPSLLKGVCTLTDGRPVADAEVEAHASSALLLASPLTERDRARWPRTVVTRTNAAGEFVLPVDPGTYDVVVRPAEGTRFPWLVTPQVIVAPRTGTQPDPARLELHVPVGRHLPITLHDASVDLPIIHGMVRAFVGHQVPGGTVGIEVARVRTGASGEFELFLDPQAK